MAVLVAFAIYSLLSKAISRSLLTLPIIFTALGFALSVPLSASLSPDVIHEGKKILAEITLILILFSDASHVRFKKLVMDWQIPTRMLVIGLPLASIVAGVSLVTNYRDEFNQQVQSGGIDGLLKALAGKNKGVAGK